MNKDINIINPKNNIVDEYIRIHNYYNQKYPKDNVMVFI